MNPQRDEGELLLFWLVPLLGLTWMAAFLLFPGFVHPMSPALSADQVAAFYRDPENLPRIRASMVLFNWFGIALVPFLALITVQIGRMAHRTAMLKYCYFGCLTGGPVLFFIADLFWLLAAFRPERPAGETQLFNDVAWVTFTSQVGFLIAQCLFLALAIYLDRQARPVFPRWVAHFNLIVAAALVPAAFVGLALSGPLAWDGALSFWLRNGAITAWIVVMTLVMGRKLHARGAEAEAAR